MKTIYLYLVMLLFLISCSQTSINNNADETILNKNINWSYKDCLSFEEDYKSTLASILCLVEYGYNNDPETCEEDYVDFPCYLGNEISKNNETFCDEFYHVEKSMCKMFYSLYNNSFSSCDKVDEDVKEMCISILASKNNNKDLCLSLGEIPQDFNVQSTCGNGICEEHEFLNSCSKDCKKEETKTYEFCITGCIASNNINKVSLYGTDKSFSLSSMVGPDYEPELYCGDGGDNPTRCSCSYCFEVEEVHPPLLEIESKHRVNSPSACLYWIKRYGIDGEFTYFNQNKDLLSLTDTDNKKKEDNLEDSSSKEIRPECDYRPGFVNPYNIYFPYNESVYWHPVADFYKENSDTDFMDMCLKSLSLYSSENNCELITNIYEKSNCFYGVAISTKNISYCEQVLGAERTICIQKINLDEAIRTSNIDLCHEPKKSEDYDILENCVTSIAINENKPKYCDNMTEGYFHREKKCRQKVAEANV